MAETERKASAELRKKAAPAKQTRMTEQKDRVSLSSAFGSGPGKLSTTLDQYNRYILVETDESGQTFPVYLFVAPNGRDWERLNGTEAIKRIKETYKDQEALRKTFYDKGYLSKKEYETKDTNALNSAILQAATQFSTEVADSFTTEGKVKFPTFQNWVSSKASYSGNDNEPRRDINLADRDSIRALIEDIYMENNMQLPDDPAIIESKVDRYMKQIEKGVLTTYSKNKAGETVSKSTPAFSETQVRAELGKEIPKELPIDYQRAQSLNFLSFLSQMEQG